MDYAQVLKLSHDIHHSMTCRLMAYYDGKPVEWNSPCVGDFIVRPKLLGGSGISRSEKLMNRILNTEGVLETSRGALWARLDPFHDHAFRLNGHPDSVNGQSVSELYKQSVTFTAPSGVGGNWDLNLVLFPSMISDFVFQYAPAAYGGGLRYSNELVISNYSGSSPMIGGLTAFAAGAGTVPLTLSSAYSSTPLIPTTGSGPTNLVAAVPGSYRVYGVGLEIINATAPLYQQGTLTCWAQQMPNPIESQTAALVTSIGGAGIGAASVLMCPAPPESLAEAMLLGGSRQWHAKEGAYIIATSNSDENYLVNNQAIIPIYYSQSQQDVIMYGTGYSALGFTSFNCLSAPRSAIDSFNMHGAYLSNLSNQTSITVNIRTFIEIFPTQIGNPLTSLAQPSAPYDRFFLWLISECMKDMPPGVMLSENGFGDWLSDVVGKISSFVKPIAGVVSNVAGAIGTVFPPARAIAGIANMVEGVAGTLAPGSGQVRNDGVQEMKREERIINKERAARATAVKAAVPKTKAQTSLQLRQQIAMDKLRLKGITKRR
jgi:hypothetical protein